MEKSPTIGKLAAALSTFQSKVGKIKKGSENPFLKNKYAALPDILEAIQEPLQTAGLTFAQFPDGDHGLTTILIHTESGEYLQASFNMPPVKNDPQGIGSAITYARRYALGAVLGLNIDVDDDGNGASGKNGKQVQQQTRQQAPPADSLARFRKAYQTPAEVGGVLMEAKNTKEVGTLYYANQEMIEKPENAKLKESFTAHKNALLSANQQPA